MADLTSYFVWFVTGASFILLLSVGISAALQRANPAAGANPATAPGIELTAAQGSLALPNSAGDRAVTERLRKEKKRADMDARMIQAGLYSRNASVAFLVTRIMLGGCMVGLGLAISRDLTTQCGGTLEAHSMPDSGMCFRFRFPLI